MLEVTAGPGWGSLVLWLSLDQNYLSFEPAARLARWQLGPQESRKIVEHLSTGRSLTEVPRAVRGSIIRLFLSIVYFPRRF